VASACQLGIKTRSLPLSSVWDYSLGFDEQTLSTFRMIRSAHRTAAAISDSVLGLVLRWMGSPSSNHFRMGSSMDLEKFFILIQTISSYPNLLGDS
jgi:hypothetical protein